ncbi:TolC family protein [Mucilaginibacter angelicae]|uniref:TolC family protein n=1 Tax=Mucilaginibacter angelicae TaxID=869718 RepID=A0ABV6L101_9SPHI
MDKTWNMGQKYKVSAHQEPEPSLPTVFRKSFKTLPDEVFSWKQRVCSGTLPKGPVPLIKFFILLNTFITGASLSCTAQASSQNPAVYFTIDELWQKASLNSKVLKIRELELLQHKEEVKDAIVSRLPDISLDGEYAKLSNLPQFEDGIFHSPTYYPVANNTYSLGASVFFNLYNAGHLNRQIDAQKINVKISEQQRNLTESEIKLLATAYYLDLLRGRAFQELLRQDITEQNKVLLQIKAIYKNGVILKSDVLRAELKLSRQTLQVNEIKSDNAIALQKVNLLTGQADSTPIEPLQPFLPDTIQLAAYETLLSKALAGAHEINISQEERNLSELRLRDVRANTQPVIGLFANYAYSYPQGRFYPYVLSLYGLGSVGVRASLPLSSLFKNKHRVNIAALEVKKNTMEHLDIEDQIRNRLKEVYLRFLDDQERIRVARSSIIQATENLRIVKNSYLNQTSLITDYLDADVQLLQTKFDLTAARVAAQLRYYQLQKIIGTL